MSETKHESAGHEDNAFDSWMKTNTDRRPSSDLEWESHAHASAFGEWQRTSPDYFARRSPAYIRREQRNNQTELRQIFEGLASKWRNETLLQSSLIVRFQNPAYKAIILLGKEVLPLIFERVKKGEKSWGYALKEITGVNPAISTDNPSDANEAWLNWWKQF